MKPPRICAGCHEPIDRQKYWHHSKKAHNKHGSTWCNGPRTTPGGERSRPRLPVHYRFYADYPCITACGLKPGWTKGGSKQPDAQVPWSRVNVKMSETTCEECLSVLTTFLEGRLAKRLAETGGTREAAFERAEGRHAMRTLDKLVHGAAA